LSRTLIAPERGAVSGLAATLNATRSSPLRGMPLVTVIQVASETAVHTHAFCCTPPQVFGSLIVTTSKASLAPVAPTVNVSRVTE
jgi:hypothetical protein